MDFPSEAIQSNTGLDPIDVDSPENRFKDNALNNISDVLREYYSFNPRESKDFQELANVFKIIDTYDPTDDPKDYAQLYSQDVTVTHLGLIPAERPSKSFERMNSHEVFQLCHLLFSGRLDDIYEARLKKEETPTKPTPDEEIHQKATIVYDYIDRVRKKSHEDQNRKDIPQITVGYEFEFHSFMKKVFDQLKKHIKYPIPQIKQAAQEITNSLQEELLADDRDPDHPDKIMTIEDKIKKLDEKVMHKNLPGHGAYTKLGLGWVSTDEWAATGVRQHIAEVATSPTSDIATQYREIYYLLSIGGLDSRRLVTHETLGGVRLSPEHTEVMDIRILSSAAGFINPPVTYDDEAGVYVEKVWKLSDPTDNINERPGYYPFHRIRREEKLYPYNGVQPADGVERRLGAAEAVPQPSGETDYSPYIGLIRDGVFSYHAAFAIAAVQKDPSKRSPAEQTLAAQWEQLMTDWKGHIAGRNISYPESKDRIMSLDQLRQFGQENPDDKKKPHTAYNRYLTDAIHTSQQDPEFQKSVRTMITKFNKKVKEIIY